MAAVLPRRAATAIAATIRADRPVRKFSALATPRLPAAATKKTNPGRPSFPTTAGLRHNHNAAALTETVQGLEGRVQRLELDVDSKILRMEVVLKKEAVEAYEKYLAGQSTINDKVSRLGDLILAESRRSVQRAATSSAESVRSINQVGKTSWRVVVLVVTAAATTGFSVAQLLRAYSKTEQEDVAGKLISKKTAELEQHFTRNLEATVERAVELVMAKEATRKSNSREDTMHAFDARLEAAFNGLDERISRAVELAMAKQAVMNKTDPEAKGGPRN